MSKKKFYVLLVTGAVLFVLGIVGSIKLSLLNKDNASGFFSVAKTLTGLIIAPVGFFILLYLWKHTENRKQIKLNTVTDRPKVQSFSDLMYKGPWKRWGITIFTIWFLFWLNGGGFEGSLISGSLYGATICFGFSLILFVPVYLLASRIEQKKQLASLSKAIASKRSRNGDPCERKDDTKGLRQNRQNSLLELSFFVVMLLGVLFAKKSLVLAILAGSLCLIIGVIRFKREFKQNMRSQPKTE